MSEINSIKPAVPTDLNGPMSATEQRAKRSTESTQTPTALPTQEGDKVSLSDTLSQLGNVVAEVPEVDKSKVDAIKASIDSGTYEVDSKQLAQKLMGFEGEL